jgi:hypothetical protein
MRHGRLFFVAALLSVLCTAAGPARAAVGCDLDEPDKDVARLFPGSTGYKTVSLEVQKLGGNALLSKIEAKLRDKLHGLYETIDVPYTVYQIYAKEKKIGYIHGVNQKGRYGGIQIFLVLDPDLRITTFYIQKISGEYGPKFRDAEFGKQFVGLTLADFDKYDVMTGKGSGRVPEIKNPVVPPSAEAEFDFRHILRGTKKNLILVNEFIRMSPELSAKTEAAPK